MSGIRKTLGLAALDSYLGLTLQIISTVIIARILTPEQTGIFAVAAVFAALASTFRDFGVAEYLIQETELTRDRIRAALALNIAASWGMAAALAGTAFVAGRYYGNPTVTDVMLVQSLNFLLVPFGAVTQAWFRRELNYTPIVTCNLLANLSSFTVSISLAMAGHGPLALAWGSLAGIVVTVVVISFLQPADFPRWPGLREWRRVFDFGKFATGIYIVAQFGKGAPELVLGRVGGLVDVGLFSRARGLVEMFTRLAMRPVMQVCLPYLARADREAGSMSVAYLRGVTYLTAIGWPVVGFMGLAAYAAIRMVYGDQWVSAVPAAQVLCLACCVELPFILSREALLARGEARRASGLQLQLVALQLIGLAAVVPWGMMGVAYGLLAAAVAGLLVAQWHLKKTIGVSFADLGRACLPSAMLSLVVLGPLAAMLWLVPIGEHNYLRYGLIGGSACALLWVFGLRWLRHPLWAELSGPLQRGLARLRGSEGTP